MTADEKPKSEESKVADEMDAEMNEREAERLEGEQDEQQDLNQGMDTGTHSFDEEWSGLGSFVQESEQASKASGSPEG